MATPLRTTRFLARYLVLGALAFGGAFVVLVSQASSPDYRTLWWSILPYTCVLFVGSLGYAAVVKTPVRWVGLLIFAIASLSFVEFTLRVWP